MASLYLKFNKVNDKWFAFESFSWSRDILNVVEGHERVKEVESTRRRNHREDCGLNRGDIRNCALRHDSVFHLVRGRGFDA